MLVALLLAAAPQAACETTVHVAPPPLPAVGRRIAVEGDLMVALGPQASPPTVTFWRWSLDGWAFEDSAVVPVDPFFLGGAVAIAHGDVLIATTDAFSGASVEIFSEAGGSWSTSQSLYPFTSYSHGSIDDVDLISRDGDVYLGNTWNGEIQRLTRDTSGVWSFSVVATNQWWPSGFGQSLDMDAGWLISSGPGIAGGGRAFLYPRLSNGALGAPTELASSLGAFGFASEVAVDGGVAVARSGSGPIEAFQRTGQSWVSMGEVVVPGGYLSTDVERMHLRDGILALGLPNVPNGGRVIELKHDFAGFWTWESFRRPLVNTDSGLGVDLLRTPYGTVAGGDGYVQRWAEDTFQFSFCECTPAVAPCGNPGPTGCLNASGMSGRLDACGSRSIADANLAFVATRLNPGTWGMIFHGSAAGAQFNSQNGSVCVGSPTWRYLPHLAHGSELVVHDVIEFDQANHPQIGRLMAGETYGFQLWYRDVGGPCGAASNFTNAVGVRFLP